MIERFFATKRKHWGAHPGGKNGSNILVHYSQLDTENLDQLCEGGQMIHYFLPDKPSFQSWALATTVRAGHSQQLPELGTPDNCQSWALMTTVRAGHSQQLSELGTRENCQS